MSESESVQTENDVELSAEERAEAVGWSPDGDLSAEDFLSRRDDNLGLMRSNLKTIEKRLAEQTKQMGEMSSFLRKAQSDARRQGYEQALLEARDAQRRAVEEGDGAAFSKAKEEEDSIKEEMAEVAREPVDNPAAQVAETVNQFQADNKEIFEDFDLSDRFSKAVAFVKNKKPTAEVADILEEAKKITLKGSVKVSSSETSSTSGSSRRGKGFADMPKSAQAAASKFIDTSDDAQKKEYARIYFSQED